MHKIHAMMQRKDDLKKLIEIYNRRLQVLKEKAALYGLETPAHILIEIEDLEAEIEQLQDKLSVSEDNADADKSLGSQHRLLDITESKQISIITRSVFISYVRDNKDMVDKLCQSLMKAGVDVWLDRNDIAPGSNWKDAIRNAIENGSFFIACFSAEYNARSQTYMNEELNLAIEQLRQRRPSQTWFIPVLLSGDIPDWQISPGKTLKDLQWVKIDEHNWNSAFQKILRVIGPTPSEKIRTLQLLLDVAIKENRVRGSSRLTWWDVRDLYTNRKQITFDQESIRIILKALFSNNETAIEWIQEFPEYCVQGLSELLYSEEESIVGWICTNLRKCKTEKRLVIPVWIELSRKVHLSSKFVEMILDTLLEFGEIEPALDLFSRVILDTDRRYNINVQSYAEKISEADRRTQPYLYQIATSTGSLHCQRAIAQVLLNSEYKDEAQRIIENVTQELTTVYQFNFVFEYDYGLRCECWCTLEGWKHQYEYSSTRWESVADGLPTGENGFPRGIKPSQFILGVDEKQLTKFQIRGWKRVRWLDYYSDRVWLAKGFWRLTRFDKDLLRSMKKPSFEEVKKAGKLPNYENPIISRLIKLSPWFIRTLEKYGLSSWFIKTVEKYEKKW